MRGTRWLLLVAIAAIIFGVGVTYQVQKRNIQRDVVKAPPPLAPEVASDYPEGAVFVHKNQSTGCKVELTSERQKAASDTARTELTGVKLKMFRKTKDGCDSKFDLVQSQSATFFEGEGRLYAEGTVEITLSEPAEGEPPPSLISIKSSGVSYDTSSGKADTDRPAEFTFKNGSGHSTGAIYDPPSKELLMKHDVVVDWKSQGPHAKPMHIEAPTLQYHETQGLIDLTPTGRMTREDMTFEGEKPTIHLRNDGKGHEYLNQVDAEHAHGTDTAAGRKLAYSGDRIWAYYNDDHLIERIVAEGNAELTSTAATSETHLTAHHVEMFFEPQGKDSQLTRVTCDGNAVATSKPLPGPGRQPTETHVLHSESIGLKMRPGGRDIDTVSAHPSGVLEFVPNLPAQHHRVLQGDEMLINYAPQNRIESFRASNVKTTTDPTADEARRNRAVATTASRNFTAHFDPQTGQMTTMEQSGDFAYREGDRRASATRATFDQKQNVMNLDAGASVSDLTGSTTADHIRLDQHTDDFTAEGNVNSVRQPDKTSKNNSGMLAGDAPLHAQARKMESVNRGTVHHTRYEGGARLWQGANRISADTVDIDREKHNLTADGNVVTEAWEQPKPDDKKKGSAAVLTTVHAPHLVYTDQDRLAYYSGGVQLDRPDLHLRAHELKAWMADAKAESQLDKAFAQGEVEITGASKTNSYKGTAEHAEYYAADQKVILNGGSPQLVRTTPGQKPFITQALELNYFLNSGNLETKGEATDRIPPKKK